jgi:hypothetical protein
MQNRQAIDAQQLLVVLQHHLRARTEDGEVFCELGPLLRSAGKEHEARQCYKRVVEIIRTAAPARRRQIRRCTSSRASTSILSAPSRPKSITTGASRTGARDMARLGRRFRDPRGWPEADPHRIGFVLVTGFRLAHSKVMLRTLSAHATAGDRALEAAVLRDRRVLG